MTTTNSEPTEVPERINRYIRESFTILTGRKTIPQTFAGEHVTDLDSRFSGHSYTLSGMYFAPFDRLGISVMNPWISFKGEKRITLFVDVLNEISQHCPPCCEKLVSEQWGFNMSARGEFLLQRHVMFKGGRSVVHLDIVRAVRSVQMYFDDVLPVAARMSKQRLSSRELIKMVLLALGAPCGGIVH